MAGDASAEIAVSPPTVPLRRGLPLMLLGVLALCQLAFAIGFGFGGESPGKDFITLYAVSQLSLAGAAGEIANQPHLFAVERALVAGTPSMGWFYPPVMLLLAAPLALLPYIPALAAWLTATSLPLIILIRRLIGLPLALAAILPALLHNAAAGQNGALIASLLFSGIAAIDRRRPWLAGLFFGLVICKPQACLLVPICLLAGRCYRTLAAMVVTAGALFAATIVFFGVAPWESFFARLSPALGNILAGVPMNRFPTVFIAVLRLTGQPAAAQAAQAVSSLLAVIAVSWVWRRHAALLPRVTILAAAMPLATPYMLDYDLTLTAVPAAFLFLRAWRGAAAPVDWLVLPVFWLVVPAIWLASYLGLSIGLPLVLVMVAYALLNAGRLAAAQLKAA